MMLSGLLDVITKPLEDYIASVATQHAEKVGEQLIRTMVTREVKDFVIPRVAVVAGLIATSAAVNIYAFASRNRRSHPTLTARQALEGFRNPIPRETKAGKQRRARRKR